MPARLYLHGNHLTVGRRRTVARPASPRLAQELGNVSKACRIVGYSRQQFYEIRRSFSCTAPTA